MVVSVSSKPGIAELYTGADTPNELSPTVIIIYHKNSAS